MRKPGGVSLARAGVMYMFSNAVVDLHPEDVKRRLSSSVTDNVVLIMDAYCNSIWMKNHTSNANDVRFKNVYKDYFILKYNNDGFCYSD